MGKRVSSLLVEICLLLAAVFLLWLSMLPDASMQMFLDDPNLPQQTR